MNLTEIVESLELLDEALAIAEKEIELMRTITERRHRARTKSDRKYKHVDAERSYKSYQAWKGNTRRFAETYKRKNPIRSKHLTYNLVRFW